MPVREGECEAPGVVVVVAVVDVGGFVGVWRAGQAGKLEGVGSGEGIELEGFGV